MGYAENAGTYWRGRYKSASGKLETVRDQITGKPVHFETRRDAKRAADRAEADDAEQAPQARNADTDRWMTFGAYARSWYARQDLAASTMQNYRRHIENHLLPTFEDSVMRAITAEDVDHWEKAERKAGYAEASIKTWRGTLHLLCEDAQTDGIVISNPATKRRGRGKRAGRGRTRRPEKVIANILNLILIAERASLLSGRDDEFVGLVVKGATGMRWGELVGLESLYVRPDSIRVEWQLYELDTGEFVRCPPKDDSYRTIDMPEFLACLIAEHINRVNPKSCKCHGRKYVFSGHRPANKAARAPGAKLVDVARLADVSTGTVSNVLNRPDSVPEPTRVRVMAAITELRYVRGGPPPGELAPHWRRSGFATWLFQPAATGWFPQAAPNPPRPVPVLGEPWPGVPARGRGASGRADACWLPIAAGLTPHGLRHSHKTEMDEMGVPAKLKDDRMGHADGSVGARYSHITAAMRQALCDGLTERWIAALHARRDLSPRSPVGVLDRLLRAL
ncbi:LacI family DNA-binding transcriptional regulator [Actinoplanes sp. NPDC051346]|uniref:LacI family DNA-binding transcriptional regulator n=1 Tax=Actinoplanes sp. NPDC051346 TaxID=3155048 RepID=UPI00343AD6ED